MTVIHRTSSSSSFVALLVLVAVLRSAHAVGPTCADCRGSVQVTWPNADCSGGFEAASTMTPIAAVGAPVANECTLYQDSDALYVKWRCAASKSIIADQFLSSSCSGTPLASLHFATGLCAPNPDGSSSAAFFCSAADAAAATTLTQTGGNGTVPPGTPAPSSEPIICANNNCPKGFLVTRGYMGSSCGGAVIQSSYSLDSQLGVCFNNSVYYSTKSEISGGNYITNFYYGGGCDIKPLSASYFALDKCFSVIGGLSAQYSSASSIVASVPLLALLALFLAGYTL